MRVREPLRFLVAEDDSALREELVDALRLGGNEVRDASSGAVAIEEAHRWLPDVVVVDYFMPFTDGISLIAYVRAMVRPIPPAILAMSGVVRAARWCTEIGVDAFLAKPFTLATFDAMVDYVGERRAASMQNPQSQRPSGSDPMSEPRRACVLGVGEAAEGIGDVLTASLRNARVVVVDSPYDAAQTLADILPDLVVVTDQRAHLRVREAAEANGVSCMVLHRTPHAHASG